MKAMLIVFEGIDNCGKTTQIALVKTEMEKRGIPCVMTKELTTSVGAEIKRRFKKGGFSPFLKTILFALDRLIRQKNIVNPALKEGRIVLADRWTLSAVVYRSVEGIGDWFVNIVNFWARKPDITILFDIFSETSVKRGEKSGKYCPYSQEFLSKARVLYLKIAKQQGIHIVDGEQSVEMVALTVLKILNM